ncbi:MAG: hypothetical protein L0H83_01380 [Salinisphaera sp.]|nr:hypothetical protein [Salinisphaera sp.]
MSSSKEAQFLHETLKGNTEAVRFCQLVFRISQVLDDLHDGDKPVTKTQLHQFAWELIEELPTNGFYQRHFTRLQPVLRHCLLDWMDSCALEQGDARNKTVAYVIRDTTTMIVSHCAYLIGGFEYMHKISPDLRKRLHSEPINDYISGLSKHQEVAP